MYNRFDRRKSKSYPFCNLDVEFVSRKAHVIFCSSNVVVVAFAFYTSSSFNGMDVNKIVNQSLQALGEKYLSKFPCYVLVF